MLTEFVWGVFLVTLLVSDSFGLAWFVTLALVSGIALYRHNKSS